MRGGNQPKWGEKKGVGVEGDASHQWREKVKRPHVGTKKEGGVGQEKKEKNQTRKRRPGLEKKGKRCGRVNRDEKNPLLASRNFPPRGKVRGKKKSPTLREGLLGGKNLNRRNPNS